MEIIKVDAETLNKYVVSSKKPHYLQTGAWGEVNEVRNITPNYLLVKDGDEIIGSALLLQKKVLHYSTYYCPRGFITDFENKDYVKKMIEVLTKYVKDNNGLYLKIDPDIIIRKHNPDASVKEEFNDKLELLEYIKTLGGKHRGFTKKFKDSSIPRYTFRVNVAQDNLLESFHPTTRKLLRRNNPYNIKVFIGDNNNLDDFYSIMKDTASRKHIYLEDKSFFETFYNVLHKWNMADLYVAKVDVNELKLKYMQMIEEVEKELKSLEGSNKKGKIVDLNNQLVKYNKEIKDINKINKDELILSSIITTKFGDKVWTIHGANANEIPFVNANYEIYWQIIKDARDQGYNWVDFYGTEGDIDKDSDAYGIYNFKVRFGGDFDEFIGEFDFITKPFAYKIIMFALKIRRRLKYIIQQIVNK